MPPWPFMVPPIVLTALLLAFFAVWNVDPAHRGESVGIPGWLDSITFVVSDR